MRLCLRIWRGSSPTLHQSGAVSQILPRNLAEISLSDCKDGCSRTMFRLELSPFVECSELTEMFASVCGCLPAVASGFERLLVYCAQSAAAFVQFARTGSICDASSSHRLRKARQGLAAIRFKSLNSHNRGSQPQSKVSLTCWLMRV